LKADGHVTIKTATAEVGGILRRVVAFIKPKEHVQQDEFRFFKRHGQTSIEASVAHASLLAARERHDREVDENNERMAMIAVARGKAA